MPTIKRIKFITLIKTLNRSLIQNNWATVIMLAAVNKKEVVNAEFSWSFNTLGSHNSLETMPSAASPVKTAIHAPIVPMINKN